MECGFNSRYGESNTIYLTLTAKLETISWKVRGKGAYLRDRQNSVEFPKLIRPIITDMDKRKLNECKPLDHQHRSLDEVSDP